MLDRERVAEIRGGKRKEMCFHVGVPTNIYIRYAENNSNIVKTQCLFLSLNVLDFPATNRTKSIFCTQTKRAHGSLKRIHWQYSIFLIRDCVKCKTSREHRQFLNTCVI